MNKRKNMEYSIGDIVFLHNKSFTYPDGSDGEMHPFVIVSVSKGEFDVLPAEYSAFLISSAKKQEKRPYNEKLLADNVNRLIEKRNHVKCNYLFKSIKEEDILYKLGEVTREQLARFVELYISAKSKGELQGE